MQDIVLLGCIWCMICDISSIMVQYLARIGIGGARYVMYHKIGVHNGFRGCKIEENEGTTYIIYNIYRIWTGYYGARYGMDAVFCIVLFCRFFVFFVFLNFGVVVWYK